MNAFGDQKKNEFDAVASSLPAADETARLDAVNSPPSKTGAAAGGVPHKTRAGRGEIVDDLGRVKAQPIEIQ